MRIVDAVTAIAQIMPEREIVIARELTKLHEEFIRGTTKDVLENLKNRDSIKGEMVIIIAPSNPETKEITDKEIEDHLKTMLSNGESLKSAVKTVCELYGLNKNHVYDLGKKL